MNKGIAVDPIRGILIRLGFEAIPVVKEQTWQYNEEETSKGCWRVIDVGHQ